MWGIFPFVPDSLELSSFQGYVYQTVDINSCGREELEALPFLTPEQVDSVLRHRPYSGWKDFVRRSGLPLPVLYALKGIVRFGNEGRYYALFLRAGFRGGEGRYLTSFKGRTGSYTARLYLSDSRRALAVEYRGRIIVAAGNYVLASPLGFAGYGGFYTGGWGPRYNPYAPPSLLLGVGLLYLKMDTVGLIGGMAGREGGVLLIRTWTGRMGGVGYMRYGPIVLESFLSDSGRGLGVGAHRGGVGFRMRYFRGDRVWREGSLKENYALWISIPVSSYLLRTYVSDRRRRVSLSLSGVRYALKVEYYEVPRLVLRVAGAELGVCEGCMWAGYGWGWGWFRMYSFTADGIHIYENSLSSRLITSKRGYRLSGGIRWRRRVGVEGYVENGNTGVWAWVSVSL